MRNNWPTTSPASRGYGPEWQRLRQIVLRRDCGLCQCEQCKGKRVTPANEVHHIVSKAEAQRRGWTQQQMDDLSNLAAINHDCHVRETQCSKGAPLKPRIGIDGYPVDA